MREGSRLSLVPQQAPEQELSFMDSSPSLAPSSFSDPGVGCRCLQPEWCSSAKAVLLRKGPFSPAECGWGWLQNPAMSVELGLLSSRGDLRGVLKFQLQLPASLPLPGPEVSLLLCIYNLSKYQWREVSCTSVCLLLIIVCLFSTRFHKPRISSLFYHQFLKQYVALR